MKINLPQRGNLLKLNLSDIVVFSYADGEVNTYMVIKASGRDYRELYMFKSLDNGDTCATGGFETIEELEATLLKANGEVTIYPASEYELTLKRKGE